MVCGYAHTVTKPRRCRPNCYASGASGHCVCRVYLKKDRQDTTHSYVTVFTALSNSPIGSFHIEFLHVSLQNGGQCISMSPCPTVSNYVMPIFDINKIMRLIMLAHLSVG